MASTAALRGLADEVNSRFVVAGLALVISLMIGLQFQAVQEIGAEDSSAVEVEIQVSSPGENLSRTASVRNGTTVLEALNSTYSLEYRKSEMGYYVTSIDGISSNGTHFWMYFVDGRAPEVGVGKFRLNSSTEVQFRLLTSSQTRKYMD